MTFYDDGEFAAIQVARYALAEQQADAPHTADMHAVAVDMFERYGSEGLTALVVALGRQYASALGVVAHDRGVPDQEMLDDFEQHKLEQIDGEQAGAD